MKPGIFCAHIHDALLAHGDHYMNLADLAFPTSMPIREGCATLCDADGWAGGGFL